MSAPWLSVIMPNYNGARYIAAALDSVVSEGDPDIELIVVDDGSSDDSLDIARRYAERLNLSIIEPGRIANWVMATNIGMRAARGEYLCWLHNDDAWLPRRSAELRRLIHSAPGAALYAHSSRYIDHRGRRVGLLHAPLPSDRLLPTSAVVPKLLAANFFTPPAMLFSRRLAEEVGWMDDRLWYVADWDFALKLAQAGATVYRNIPLACYRIHPASMTTRVAHQIDALRRMFNIVLDRHLRHAEGAAQVSPADESTARFSMEVNAMLASLVSGGKRPPWRFLWRCMTLGPGGWRRYLHHSRIVERGVSRLRAGLAH